MWMKSQTVAVGITPAPGPSPGLPCSGKDFLLTDADELLRFVYIIPLIHLTVWGGCHYHHAHFTDVKTMAQGGEGNCLK